jgi:hypothetical protein
MYKVGDKVVCINNKSFENYLELNKSYIVIRIINNIFIDVDNKKGGHFKPIRFILHETYYRKQKIGKICAKLSI